MLKFRDAKVTDRDWLWALYKDLLKPSIDAQWGWNEAFQQDGFSKHLPIAQFKIIESQNDRAGAFSLMRNSDHLHLKMLLISARFQSMGLGKHVISYAKLVADEHGLPINLSVIKSNPVVRFYTNLGFCILGDDNGSYQLQWHLNAPPT